MDKISYALGLSIGNNFQNSGINNLQVEDFVKGLKDVLNEAQPEISYDEAKQVINDYFMNLQKERLELTASDKVKCHYHGTLINGTVFDSSVQRGEPAVFGVSQVIPGWVEALQLMPVGSKWRLFIPSNLAYGEHGAGDAIEPNSALVFDVELLDIVK